MHELKLSVQRNWKISESYYLLSLAGRGLQKTKPGQFAELRCRGEQGTEPYLRRPLSVFSVDRNGVQFIYKVIGRGTDWLKQREPGDEVSVLGPLGNGFTIRPAPALVICGGTGLAGVGLLLKQLRERRIPYHCLYGIKQRKDVPREALAKFRANVMIEETSGMVTSQLKPVLLKKIGAAYVCGPAGLAREAFRKMKDYIPFIQVSLEERMGCGYGVCYTCPVERTDGRGYYRTCVDGPVFDARTVVL